MQKLNFLQVTIRPMNDAGDFLELEVTAHIEHNKCTATQILHNDDFECRFDLVMDLARRTIKEGVRSARKESSPETNSPYVCP